MEEFLKTIDLEIIALINSNNVKQVKTDNIWKLLPKAAWNKVVQHLKKSEEHNLSQVESKLVL